MNPRNGPSAPENDTLFPSCCSLPSPQDAGNVDSWDNKCSGGCDDPKRAPSCEQPGTGQTRWCIWVFWFSFGGPGEIWEVWAHPNQSQHFWGTVNIACHKKHLNRWTQTTPLPVPLSSLAWDTSLCISATLSFALRWVRSMNSFPAY